MTVDAATTAVGSALRIVPQFVARTHLDDLDVDVTIQSTYSAEAGRYVVSQVSTSASEAGTDVNLNVLRKLPIGSIVQAAAPHCIAWTLDDESDPKAEWLTVAALSTNDERVIPAWLAESVVAPGNEQARMEVVELLYGASALAGIAPVKTIADELSIPHRTASDWIRRARAAGRLEGMRYHVGRKANG